MDTQYRIAGTITAPDGIGHAKAYRRERAIEPSLDKAAVPSPFTIALSFPKDPLLNDHMGDLIDVVSAEVSDMAAAGAGEIQIDAPSEAIACAHQTHDTATLADWMDVYAVRKLTHVRFLRGGRPGGRRRCNGGCASYRPCRRRRSDGRIRSVRS